MSNNKVHWSHTLITLWCYNNIVLTLWSLWSLSCIPIIYNNFLHLFSWWTSFSWLRTNKLIHINIMTTDSIVKSNTFPDYHHWGHSIYMYHVFWTLEWSQSHFTSQESLQAITYKIITNNYISYKRNAICWFYKLNANCIFLILIILSQTMVEWSTVILRVPLLP